MARRVVKASTSETLRYLFRLNGLEGSARKANANAPGYRIGGKTGTAEKVVNGRYDKNKNLTVFTGACAYTGTAYWGRLRKCLT